MTEQEEGIMTQRSHALFMAYAEDAGNWGLWSDDSDDTEN